MVVGCVVVIATALFDCAVLISLIELFVDAGILWWADGYSTHLDFFIGHGLVE